jgi:hypothetical protein
MIYAVEYNISFLGLEKLHPFDAGKWGRVHEFLKGNKLVRIDTNRNSLVGQFQLQVIRVVFLSVSLVTRVLLAILMPVTCAECAILIAHIPTQRRNPCIVIYWGSGTKLNAD